MNYNIFTNENLIKFWILLVTILYFTFESVKSQDVNEGKTQSKTGGAFSKFKESITSFQQRQQQQAILSQQNLRTISTSSTIVQKPQPIATRTQFNKLVTIEESTSSAGQQQQQEEADSEPAIYGSVQGTPGVDFPDYKSIPNTKFSCEGVPFDPGMYADESTACQVYHLCYQGRRESFLCGVGTVFNQAIMNCDFWHSVDCSKSSQYYQLNSEFGKSSSEPGGNFNLQQQKTITSSSNELSLVPQHLTNTISSSSVFNKQFSTSVVNRPVQLASKSSNFFDKIESSVAATQGSKISPPKQSFTSIEEEISRNSASGLVSPGRSFQLFNNINNQQEQQNLVESQFASSSSNQVNMATNNGGLVNKLPIVSSSVIVTQSQSQSKIGDVGSSKLKQAGSSNNRKWSKANASFGGKTKSSGQSHLSEENTKQSIVPQAPVNNVNQDGEWKPYFKSNSTTTTTQQPSIMSSMVTGAEQSTPAPADKEPTFSADSRQEDLNSTDGSQEMPKAPKSPVPPGSDTKEGTNSDLKSESDNDSSNESASSKPSMESDLNPALTSTTPTPSSEQATTLEPTKDRQLTSPQDSPTTTATSSAPVETEAPMTTSTSQNGLVSTVESGGSSSSDESESSSTSETTTMKPSSSSSVEYAATAGTSSNSEDSSSSASGDNNDDNKTNTTTADNETESATNPASSTTTSAPGEEPAVSGKKKRKRQSKRGSIKDKIVNKKKTIRTS